MESVAQDVAVARIDHVVVPTDDLGKSLPFYLRVLGGHFERLVNVNQRGLNREVPMMTFMTLANHHGFGIALQNGPIPPRVRDWEGVVCGFQVPSGSLSEVRRVLEAQGVSYQGPFRWPEPSPIDESILLEDPEGFLHEICTRRDGSAADAGQGALGLQRISHVRMEVTDIDAAVMWYQKELGLVPSNEVPGERQSTLQIKATGQLFILHEVREMTQRSLYVRGPHVDVKVPTGTYEAFVAGLSNIERYWGFNGGAIPWHEPDPQTLYFYDPFGNRLQVSDMRRGHH